MRAAFLTLADSRLANSGSTIRQSNLRVAVEALGYDVTSFAFGPSSEANDDVRLVRPRPRLPALARSLVERRLYHATRFDHTLHGSRLALAVERADLIVASMLYPMQYLAALKVRPSAPVVWDTENFDPAVWASRAAVWMGPKRWLALHQMSLVDAAMKRAESLAAVVVACSHDDARVLETALGPHTKIAVVPNAADTVIWAQAARIRPERRTVVLFGSLGQDATQRGALWFLRSIWPKVVTKVPESRLLVGGRAPSPELADQVRRSPRAELVSNPSNIVSFVSRGEIVVVPQIYGTGSKLKTFEAIASGRPVIASYAGVVGLPDELRCHVEIVRDEAEWVYAIALALERPFQYRRAAWSAVDDVGSWRQARMQMMDVVRCVASAGE